MTSAHDDVLDQEPQQIAERAEEMGAERLDRGLPELLLTSVIGGGEVSIGGLAAMAVLGATLVALPGVNLYVGLALAGLAFPIGFIFVIVGRSELFTENFLIPVVATFKTERGASTLIRLWVASWFGNLMGCAGTAVLLLLPNAIGEPIRVGYQAYAQYKLDVPHIGVFVSAVLAGAVMTALTWSLLSVQHSVGRIMVICAAAYALMAANLSHSIVSASLLFVGFSATSHSVVDVLVWMAIATAGNVVGGVGLVTLFRLAQAQQQE